MSRVLRTTGLAVEAGIGPQAADNARALADFRELAARMTRGAPSGLAAFLARLREAEHYDESPKRDEIPSGDAVLLMTVHRAKGLEFAHVVIPAMADSVFPSGRGRSRWPKSAAVVPWALHPDAPAPLAAFPDRSVSPTASAHDAFVDMSAAAYLLEERRLAYVALTRAERSLTVSGHWWGPAQVQPRGPGPFLEEIKDWCDDHGGHVAVWVPEPPACTENPATQDIAVPWPAAVDSGRSWTVVEVAAAVNAARSHAEAAVHVDDAAVQAIIATWDADIAALLDEARRLRAPVSVPVPDDLSTTALIRLAQDPDAFALDLARPMPREPHPAARLGTDIHAWIEGQYAVQTLFDLEELDAADDLDTDMRLAELREAFRRTPYAARAPLAVEEPFALALGGRVVRGRIDAVFATSDGGVEVIDWKSGWRCSLSDVQLAIYRLAWAEISGMPLDRVSAAFVMVRTGEVILPALLLDRGDVEAILNGEDLSGR